MRKRKVLWIITIFWAVAIFCFSAQPAEDSSKLSNSITQKIIDGVSELQFDKSDKQEMMDTAVKVIVRKTAHFFLYFILGILVLALVRNYPVKTGYAILIALLICLLYAATDEFHQRFVQGRSCELRDMGIDGLGACLGFAMTYIINKLSPN